jgi:hypothetical protein
VQLLDEIISGLNTIEKMKRSGISTAISILTILLAYASICGIIIVAEAGSSQTSNISGNGREDDFNRIKIGAILASPRKYAWEPATIIGEYRGWQGEGCEPPKDYIGTPVEAKLVGGTVLVVKNVDP